MSDSGGEIFAGARWIAAPNADGPLPVFRRSFRLDRLPAAKTTVAICGLGQFELSVNGDMERRIANNLSLGVALENCDALVTSLTDIAVSSTSACSSGSAAPSHVLQAIGADAGSTLRLTVGRFNTEEEIDHAILHLREKILECRSRSLSTA